MIYSVAALAATLAVSAAYDNHGASVQLFEWSWDDVAEECETFLGPKGEDTAVALYAHQRAITGCSHYFIPRYRLQSSPGQSSPGAHPGLGVVDALPARQLQPDQPLG